MPQTSSATHKKRICHKPHQRHTKNEYATNFISDTQKTNMPQTSSTKHKKRICNKHQKRHKKRFCYKPQQKHKPNMRQTKWATHKKIEYATNLLSDTKNEYASNVIWDTQKPEYAANLNSVSDTQKPNMRQTKWVTHNKISAKILCQNSLLTMRNYIFHILHVPEAHSS